ncbi:M23 family metallopeptidase [Arthrobacter echini]|nr:M23 family metallopeptidase [Arthrobacter echini]
MIAVLLVLLGAQGMSPDTPVVAAPAAVREHTATSATETTSSSAPVRVAGAGHQPFVPQWSWPLEPTPEVMRPFDRPAQRWERGHRGVDLVPGVGPPVPVLSPDDGVVSFAGTVVDRGVLSIDHGDGRISSFEPVATSLVRGDRVSRGQEVAELTAPGGTHCSGRCLHWGVRVHGEYVDPLVFVLDPGPSVLLPLDGGAEK